MSGVLPDYEFTVETVGSRQLVGSETSVLVTGVDRYTSTSQGTRTDVSVFRLVTQGGAWRIQFHRVY